MEHTQEVIPDSTSSSTPIPPVLAPVLMTAFWMLLGGAAGIKILQGIWPFFGFRGGEVTIALPVGGVVGALTGGLLGLIRNPRWLVLLMAVFAGSAAGAVAGKVPWGEIGEIGGQVAGGVVGGMVWATWLFFGARRRNPSRGLRSAERARRGGNMITQSLLSTDHHVSMPEKPMQNQSKVIAFDVDEASLIRLRQALPGCVIDEINGATAASLTRDWDPGTVDLVVVEPRKEAAETLELCRFLVSCGILAMDAPMVTDSEEETPKNLGLHRRRPNVGRRPHSPLLVLVPPSRKSIVSDLLKAGAHSCLMLPIDAKDVASMLVHARAGNQPGRHTLDLRTDSN